MENKDKSLQDVETIISRLGYSLSAQELTKHQILKLLKEIHGEKYQAVKTHISIMDKKSQSLMILNLLLENQALAKIAIAGVNQLAAQRSAELSKEQPVTEIEPAPETKE
jgi:ethanolamine utilization protein EutQ (cupin superfamily)